MKGKLREIITQKIKESGPISIAEYMHLALMHPDFGYYTTRDPFGAQGDFVTAPEMTQAFGELIGLWALDIWKSLGRPKKITFLEIGPGRGTLMHDALRAARLDPDFVAATDLYLIEPSKFLRQKQHEMLGGYAPKWIERMEDVPDQPIIVIANEVFDALPVRQFLRVGDKWMERCVGLARGDSLAIVVSPVVDAPHFEMPDDSVIEISPHAPELASAIARPIVKNRGAALIIDYGDDEIFTETLQAVSNHRAAHLLSSPGYADITAHVSFSPIETAMRKIGCRMHGLIAQGDWLHALGFKERMQNLIMNTGDENLARSMKAAYQRLTDQSSPAAMGRLFKVMAATDRATPTPPGFHL